jgi:hypothetical protein
VQLYVVFYEFQQVGDFTDYIGAAYDVGLVSLVIDRQELRDKVFFVES